MSFPDLGQEGEDALRGPERIGRPVSALSLSYLPGTDENKNIAPLSNVEEFPHSSPTHMPSWRARAGTRTLKHSSLLCTVEGGLSPLYFFISQHQTCLPGLYFHDPVTFQSAHLRSITSMHRSPSACRFHVQSATPLSEQEGQGKRQGV